jgi:hypothetical protein
MGNTGIIENTVIVEKYAICNKTRNLEEHGIHTRRNMKNKVIQRETRKIKGKKDAHK